MHFVPRSRAATARFAALSLLFASPAFSPAAQPQGGIDTTAVREIPAPDPRPNIVLFLADDWSWPHAGAYGDIAARTPTFDTMASEGILFNNAFCPAPSCTPSRLSILTGQYPHRLEEGGNHMIRFPKRFAVFPELLEEAGYAVASYHKGANFGTLKGTDWKHDPAGRDYGTLSLFLDNVARGRPFFFWYGSENPHRPYRRGVSGLDTRTRSEDVTVPAFLPDTPLVRHDLLDYFFEVSQFDREVKRAMAQLEGRGLLDNTIIVITSDNGMPFPRAKANCYDYGMRVPLVVKWVGKDVSPQSRDEFIHLSDLAPTFLEAAGVEIPKDMTGRSFLHMLTGEEAKPVKPSFWQRLLGRGPKKAQGREAVFVERERHGLGRGMEADREGHLSYPIRGVRTHEFLYLVNFRPDLWPACDPPIYVDVDPSKSKNAVLETRDSPDPSISLFFELAFGKRPKEELYDVINDPYQINNLAQDPAYHDVKKSLERRLKRWMADTRDPRANGEDDRWDHYGYYEGDKPVVTPERD